MKDLAMVALKTKKECDKELESTCIHLYNLESFLLRADNPTVGVLSSMVPHISVAFAFRLVLTLT